ncbi:MAG: hypothetical protein E7616_03650 [Ruminococcaceae bacterium]|nr:hypothetical protein [Oscillospiraceae bacterium]
MKINRKRFLEVIYDITPHLSLVLCLMHITFLIVDLFNRAMAFVNNDITKWLLLVSAVLALTMCSDLHAHADKTSRLFRVSLRVSVITACLILFVFILDHETKIINTTTTKYMLYIYTLNTAILSFCGILHRRKVYEQKNYQ